MVRIFKSLILLVITLPLLSTAQMKSGDLPSGTKWYLHVDLEQMRKSSSGRTL
jgi:hypothetical protein